VKRIGLVALAALTVALVGGSALADAATNVKVTAFTARYTGLAVVKVTDDIADISANGAGTGVVIGASKVTGIGKGNAAVQPCVPFTGTGTMSSPKAKLLFKVIPGSQGCGDEEGNFFSIVGRAVITKGTGKFLKARGNLKLTGTYDRSTGKFTVKFTGRITQAV
jgi:hypothetical protein